MVGASDEIVEAEAEADFPEWPGIGGVDWEEKWLRVDEMRGELAEEIAFAAGFGDEGELTMFEIAEAAVDEFAGTTGSAGGEVGLLDQGDAKTTERGVTRDAGAENTAANDQQVKRGAGQLGKPNLILSRQALYSRH